MHAPYWYEPPARRAGAPEIGRAPGAEVALFTPHQIALATFLGSALGGSALLGLNEVRLGRPRAGALSVLFGVFGSAALLALAFATPDTVPASPLLGLPSIVVMHAIAQKRQGALVGAHLAAGGKKASSWGAAGVGVLALVVLLVPVFAIAFAAELVNPS